MYIWNNFKVCSNLLFFGGERGDLLAYRPMGSADSPSLADWAGETSGSFALMGR
jgi:hypothetical protein